mmetsp:Transcript_153712/g.373204  ORF Transcript_153712/g.373204 Transcript_153712/m.373204 type:complete len:283 (-) Transcript_153712:172-1020(-)
MAAPAPPAPPAEYPPTGRPGTGVPETTPPIWAGGCAGRAGPVVITITFCFDPFDLQQQNIASARATPMPMTIRMMITTSMPRKLSVCSSVHSSSATSSSSSPVYLDTVNSKSRSFRSSLRRLMYTESASSATVHIVSFHCSTNHTSSSDSSDRDFHAEPSSPSGKSASHDAVSTTARFSRFSSTRTGKSSTATGTETTRVSPLSSSSSRVSPRSSRWGWSDCNARALVDSAPWRREGRPAAPPTAQAIKSARQAAVARAIIMILRRAAPRCGVCAVLHRPLS